MNASAIMVEAVICYAKCRFRVHLHLVIASTASTVSADVAGRRDLLDKSEKRMNEFAFDASEEKELICWSLI